MFKICWVQNLEWPILKDIISDVFRPENESWVCLKNDWTMDSTDNKTLEKDVFLIGSWLQIYRF